MEDLKKLLLEQQKIGEEIDSRFTNFNKEPLSRRTKQATETHGEKLKCLWDKFKINHGKIVELDTLMTSVYLKEGYFNEIEGLYETYLNIIRDRLAKLDSENGDQSEEGKSMRVKSSEDKDKEFERKLNWDMLMRAGRVYSSYNFDNCSKSELVLIVKRVDKYFNCFAKAHFSVVESGEGNRTELQNEYENAMESYENIVSLVERQQAKLGTGETESSTRTKGKEKIEVKLPRVDIPKFYGEPERWPEFRDLFSVLIHEKDTIPEVQKMQYLKTNVFGSALDMIRHLSVNANDYKSAWEILNKRYNNKKLLINNNLKRLFSQPIMQHEKSKGLKELLDTTKEIKHALHNLDENVPDSILIFLVTQRLPNETLALWEQTCGEEMEIATFERLENFLESRFRTLETIEKKCSSSRNQIPFHTPGGNSGSRFRPVNALVGNKSEIRCVLCNESHSIFACRQFNAMGVKDRHNFQRERKLCAICLGMHKTELCTRNIRCYKCRGKHNTALHLDRRTVANNMKSDSSDVLLSTAMIMAKAADGHYYTYRALVDSGSMATFVTEKVVQQLGYKRSSNRDIIMGIGGSQKVSKGTIRLVFRSYRGESQVFETEALILPKLTSWVPASSFDFLKEYEDLPLADPSFNKSGKVDIILGSDILKEIILEDVRKGSLLAQNTSLGWILSGPLYQPTGRKQLIASIAVNETGGLDEILQRFWDSEEKYIETNAWTEEEVACEEHYAKTIRHDKDGRYIASLPFKTDSRLGRSRHKAVACMMQLEKKFRSNRDFKTRYVECMQQYLEMGHAVPARTPESYFIRDDGKETYYECFYLPHMAVIKEASLTTKTRIVFNASSKSANGMSLNDCLMVGPTIQKDIVGKILRFRMHKYVMVCDAEKMYHQIKMHFKHWPYQRFLWRENENEPLQEFCCTTVVFGESSAPYTAVRTLKQIAIDNKVKYPLASEILEEESYMDDMHIGTECSRTLILGRDQLIMVLQQAGFLLRKWCTNCPEALVGITLERCETGDEHKFMGISWNSSDDYLSLRGAVDSLSNSPLEVKSVKKGFTKREMLGEISRHFDPMGWVSPILIKAKILMQKVWKQGIGWDEALPETLSETWEEVRCELREIPMIRIPRWTQYGNAVAELELHGFSDASQTAYGAVIYMRRKQANGDSSVHQILAKSRVAPIKEFTIARLELKAALVLVDLMKKVVESLSGEHPKIFGWIDSKVALAWIQGRPEKWKPFVRNKVHEITHFMQSEKWHYVKSSENPADLISRGCSISDIQESKLWWVGPEWLRSWAQETPQNFRTIEESRKEVLTFLAVQESDNLLAKIERSRFSNTIAVLGWILRFGKNCKGKNKTTTSWLSVAELRKSHTNVIRLIQAKYFSNEIFILKQNKQLGRESNLARLYPFLDENNLLRVGGRLANASLPYEKKHPLILPSKDLNVHALIREAHKCALHGGPSATLNLLRERYWILKGTRSVKYVLHSCVTCHRVNIALHKQLMAPLPRPRVNFSKPFLHTGVDFAGPISIKFRAGRGIRPCKSYIAVFVCLSIKAFHIELVSSLTTDGFLAALKRMVARRGKVTDIYSDNGTNFVGAFRKLEKLHASLATDKIQWHFNPPMAPHFGGLWEAGVKSIKQYLVKVTGTTVLTYEEMTTVLTQIENCLNSRPLCPLSDDPSDLDTLTPNHFLIGQNYVPNIEEQVSGMRDNVLTRWELCTKIYQNVCIRYKKEYVHRLQQRPKWMHSHDNLKTGRLVLIQEENKNTKYWPLGRIMETHPGTDGLVRVVTLRTQNGLIKRPVARLSPLPDPSTYLTGNANNSEEGGDTKNETGGKSGSKTLRNPAGHSLILSLILWFGLASLILGQNISIEYFKHSPGIHFKKEGSVNLIVNYWNFTVRQNTSEYKAIFNTLEQRVEMLMQTCSKNQYECQGLVQTIRSRINDFRRQNHFLPSNRQKRVIPVAAWVAGAAIASTVGTVVYLKITTNQLNKEIEELESQQNRLLQITSKQKEWLNDTLVIMERQENRTTLDTSNINSFMSLVQGRLRGVELKLNIYSMLLHLEQVIKRCEDIDNLIFSIKNKREINRLILPFLEIHNFSAYYDEINSKLPETQRLASSLFAEELLLYPSVNRIQDAFELNFRIPIITTLKYDLYTIYPLPIVHDGEMIHIKPALKQVAIDMSSTHRSLVRIDECRALSGGQICEQCRTGSDDMVNCERTMFLHHTIDRTCTIYKSSISEVWIQMGPGIWAFIVPETRLYRFGETAVNISGSGILTEQYDINKFNTTIAILDNDEFVTSILTPGANLSDVLTTTMKHLKIDRTIAVDIKHLEADLKSSHSFISDIHSLQLHDLGPYILIAIIGAILLIKRARKLKSKRHHTHTVSKRNFRLNHHHYFNDIIA